MTDALRKLVPIIGFVLCASLDYNALYGLLLDIIELFAEDTRYMLCSVYLVVYTLNLNLMIQVELELC